MSSKSISQKSVRFLLSATRRACTSYNLYGFISKRHLNTRQTVTVYVIVVLVYVIVVLVYVIAPLVYVIVGHAVV